MRIVGDFIIAAGIEFDARLVDCGSNPSKCARGSLSLDLSRKSVDEVLTQFGEAFMDADACRRKCSIAKLSKSGASAAMRKVLADRGSKSDYSGIEKGLMDLDDAPDKFSCSDCAKIGDVVIAAECPAGMEIVTCDASFDIIGPTLDAPHRKLNTPLRQRPKP
jgi:hypothetical protein